MTLTSDLTVIRGDTIWIQFSLGVNIGSRINTWFTIKTLTTMVDSLAILQINELDHLIRLNGAVPDHPWDGSIIVTDPVAGIGWIVLRDYSARLLPLAYSLEYDIQWEDLNGAMTPVRNKINILDDVTEDI